PAEPFVPDTGSTSPCEAHPSASRGTVANCRVRPRGRVPTGKANPVGQQTFHRHAGARTFAPRARLTGPDWTGLASDRKAPHSRRSPPMPVRSWFRNRLTTGSPTVSARTPSRRRRRPTLEALEGRVVLSSYTVKNTNDSGADSLRQAILDANAQGGANTIDFQQGLTGTITLTSGELDITNDLTITRPGAN